jgi:aspartyl-tRNA synthetase
MEQYGSDKPDLRIDLRVRDVTALLRGCGFEPFDAGLRQGRRR